MPQRFNFGHSMPGKHPFTEKALQADLHQLLPSAVPNYWVALSGGLDSSVLLHALVRLKLPVKAVHINHQLSPNAADWQRHCVQLCESLGVALHAEAVEVINTGGGVEDAARQARYQVFERLLGERGGEGDVLLTGHHQDDQAETLLLRLMRGAGPKGLAAMASQRPLGRATLLRPLLRFSRAALLDYAQQHLLSWVEDESNNNTDFDRNYLRQQVMPLLEQRWPGFAGRWQQAAQLCGEADQLMSQQAAEDLASADERAERLGVSLSLPFLQSLPIHRRHQLLRHWLSVSEASLAVPEQCHLQEVDEQLIHARNDARSEVRWGEVSLRRFQSRLYRLPLLPALTPPLADIEALDWCPGEPLILPEGGWLTVSAATSSDAGQVVLSPGAQDEGDADSWQVRFRRGGERCKPSGRGHSQTLKKLLLEYGLEPWLRDRVPLVYRSGELAAVGDLWVCEGFESRPGEGGYLLNWRINGQQG